MAEAFFEKILSFFHRGTNDKAKTAPSSQKRINRNEVVPTLDPPPQPWATSETQWNFLRAKNYSNWNVPEDTNVPTDIPPAYSDALNDNTPETIAVDHPDEHVQICPHEFLTLTRCLRIIKLPRFRYNGAKIDALTPDVEFHHRGHDSKTKECQDSCKPLGIIKDSGFVGSLKGFGTYSYQTPPSAGSIGGLALSFHWDMKCLDPKQVTYRTTIELQSFLKTSGISLCPHKKLSDIDIVNALHPTINRSGKPADPIDRYLAKEGIEDCAMCGTKIKISLREDGKRGRTCQVDTKRWLGGGAASDEHWRNQCVKPLKRHTSGKYSLSSKIVLGIAPALPNQQIYQPTNSSRSSLSSLADLPSANQSYSELDSQLLKSSIVRCQRRSYGIIDNPESCRNAFHSIPTGLTQRYTFGSRSLGFFEVPLPHRFLSPDGLCAIDIDLSPRGAQWDSATYDEVAGKAAAVLNECVLDKRRGPPTGGIVGGLGSNGGLIVIIRTYVPDVDCDPAASFEDGGTCAIAVGTIPTTRQKTTFTHQKSTPSRQTPQVEIPVGGKVFTERSNTCKATVELRGDEPEQRTWFDIWQAAVAVDKICVENGHKGFSYVEGTNDYLIVSVGP